MKGNGNSYDFGERIYDSRLGKWLSIDALTASYPFYTPYQFAGNKPIWAIDIDGLEEYYTTSGQLIGKYGTSTEQRIVTDAHVSEQSLSCLKESINIGSVEDLNLNSTALSEPWTTVEDVTEGAALETWANNGENCNTAARKQLANEGVTPAGGGGQITMSADNAQQKKYNDPKNKKYHPQLTEKYVKGILTIKDELDKGNPVMVGLTEITDGSPNGGTETGNYNVKTQHFVVIVGMGNDANGNYFIYMDNATPDGGADLINNKLYYSPEKLSDDTSPPMDYSGVTEYKVTEVRPNN